MSLLTIFAGKQGRTANQPQDDPTTHVSPVNVHHQHQNRNYDYAAPPNNYANTDPNMMAHQAHQVLGGDAYSAADIDQRNRGAQAQNAAAHQAEKQQKKGKKVDQEELKRIVAEENESKGKLPRYPGLERWQLVEKMGDGAFSNVYRARDLDGEIGEVAIKVVRKFEMNSSQVSIWHDRVNISFAFVVQQLSSSFERPLPTSMGDVGRCSPSSGLQKAT
jgi:hypothetical protein